MRYLMQEGPPVVTIMALWQLVRFRVFQIALRGGGITPVGGDFAGGGFFI